MLVHGLEVNIKNAPVLDKGYIPMAAFCRAFEASAKDGKEIVIAVERNQGCVAVRRCRIHGTPDMAAADKVYVERLVKMLLWAYGGFKIYVCGDDALGKYIAETYVHGGAREFDADFMSNVYERPFEVVSVALADAPAEKSGAQAVGRHLDGCRIGFDAGGSDRKVSAVIDGKTVYSEEVVWHPKTQADPQYHYDEIVKAFRTAASKMPRVDGIGVSSAGVFIGNAPMVSSLFIKVPREKEIRKLVHTVFDRAAAAIGDGNVPIVVANDGDVTALAGAMGLGVTAVMGMAMGTSEAVGYVDKKGNVLGWFNELAFAPVDLSEAAMMDEWSYDVGVGCKYFSQDAVIKLAPAAGIALDERLTPAEKLKAVQALMEQEDPRAKKIFESIGVYLGHTMQLYSMFYDVEHMIVLGRVMSGKGGDTILAECKRVMAEEYPELARKMVVMLPDEKTRRVGQAVAAASLP